MSNLAQGLSISVMGILITFASLGVLILVMIVLRELFAPRATQQASRPVGAGEGAPQAEDDAAAVAAATAVAFLKDRQRQRAALGKLLETPQGRWWLMNALWRHDG